MAAKIRGESCDSRGGGSFVPRQRGPTEAMQSYFQGYALNAIDAKNRLSIPAAFREVIEARSHARTIVLAPHEREPCLIGYDRDFAARLFEKIERRFGDDFGPERDDAARLAFGATEQLGYDDNGRIVLSPILKDLGELDRLAYFVAVGDTFEIWNPAVFRETKADQPRLLRVLDRILASKGEAS